MFSVGVSDSCMVAHHLDDPFFGPAQRLHGATYTVDVEIEASALGVHHVVMDLGALRGILREALAQIDYRNLDEHPAFAAQLSTTERVAEYLAGLIGDAIAKLPVDARPMGPAVLRIRLQESPNAWASHVRSL